MSKPVCPYCNIYAELVGGAAIYPHRPDLFELKFWRCSCGAYTGTHANSPTHKPKGGLALAPLRAARIAAHGAFDKLWKRRHMSRSEAYEWLQMRLGMQRQPHIGFMDEAQCLRVLEVCADSVELERASGE